MKTTPWCEADWDGMEADVVRRIRTLRMTCLAHGLSDELRGRLWNELILPNVELLGHFCVNVNHDAGVYEVELADELERGTREEDE